MKNSRGQLLIEVLIALAISAIMLPALFNSLFTSKQGKAQESQRIAAIALLKESEEAIRSIREAGWNSFSTNGTFHPSVSGNAWILSSNAETVNGYTRNIVLSDVMRDSNGVVVASGGTVDPSTKKATLTVSWNTPYPSQVTSTMYLTRYLNNTTNTQTTLADFNQGVASGTAVVNTGGGEVVLGAGGRGDWCDPNLSITALDLPKNGVANAISAIEGKVFAGTGENASGVSYATVDISNTNPPVASIHSTFDGFKTNGIFGETNYAYLATDNNAKEIEIINISSIPYTEAGYFNAPGNGNGNGIFVLGNIGYMTYGSKLYTFDLSSKSGSRPVIGSVDLAGTGLGVVASGQYAYVATTSTTSQLQIVQVTNNGATLAVVGQAQLAGLGGKAVSVNSSATRAYVATTTSSTQKELFIIDISTKTGNRPTIGSYESNGMDPKAITLIPSNKLIFVGTSGIEYQVLNLLTESSPTLCGSLNIDAGVNGASSVVEEDGDAFAYIITGDATTELKTIEGGPGGKYSVDGTFTSHPFDASVSAAFNRFIPTVNTPNQTEIRFQVAVAQAVNNSCTNAQYSFLGPDGTSSTYFTEAGAIPLITSGNYTNPGRCFEYKAYLSTNDTTTSPILYEATVNYSP